MTSRVQMEPADPFRLYEHEQPVILAMWHGQHFMLPFLRRGYRFKVLISRHIDGEINAIAAEWLGVGTVRGSGDHGRRYHIKGGVGAFKSMMDVIAEGTEHGADRRRSESVARCRARHHQTRKRNRSADLSSSRSPPAGGSSSTIGTVRPINLPFGRAAGVVGDVVRVPVDASPEALEHARSALEKSLNAATERAYALADRRPTAVRDTAAPERLEIERRVSNNGIIAD